MTRPGLTIFGTHPVQYQAPVYRAVEALHGIPVTQIYASDFSVAGYYDRDFSSSFAWNSALAGGTAGCVFLTRASAGGARSYEEVTSAGLAEAMRPLAGSTVLLTGHAAGFYRSAIVEALRRGCRILYRAETIDLPLGRAAWKEAARDTALRLFYWKCARLLPVGAASRRHYLRLGCPPGKLFDAPYCVDTAPFQCGEAARESMRAAVRGQLGIGPERRAILMSGKLSPRKNPAMLAAAVRALPENLRQRVKLLYLGDGPLRAELERESGVDLTVLGFKNQHELSPYFHAADLLAMPSDWETWGLSVNEALHHGLPCVAADSVGCHEDLIAPGGTGELAPRGSAEGFAAALARLLERLPESEADARALRARCRERVSGYTIETAAAGIAAACRSVPA